MYFIDQKTNNITLVRGDYFACSISMTKDDVPFVPTDGTLRFAHSQAGPAGYDAPGAGECRHKGPQVWRVRV